MADCPRCRFPNPAGAKFCLNCGTALAASRPIEGERRYVTVLFADVVGSTGMGETLDPEQLTEIMNGAFALFNAAISRYAGTVSRLMGDAVLAIFGAPIAHEDDGERAVRAALEIQEAAREYAFGVNGSYGVDFRVRVGIHSGLAVLAMVGDQVKTEYTAMGDTANVAARLQGVADPGTVLISSDTRHLIGNAFDLVPRGPLDVKGRAAPVDTYEVTGARSTADKARGLDGLVTPLVGRDAELELVRARVLSAAGGHGGLVAVIGEAGIGKSRLMAEVRQWAHTLPSEPTWLEGRALSYGQTIAYYPWRQVIRAAMGAAETDDPPAVHVKLVAMCERLDLGAHQSSLEGLLQVGGDADTAALRDLEATALVSHLTEAVRAWVRALANGAPLVLVFDDLHWADEASLRLLVEVAPLVLETRLLIVILSRPDREAETRRTLEALHGEIAGVMSEVVLDPLPDGTADTLLAHLLDSDERSASLRAMILRKAEGNPFFLEEVIRSLVDSGHLARENGKLHVVRDIPDVAIPDTLIGVLSSRIDRLPETTKRVAQTAAVIGRIFPYPVLTAACAQAPPEERVDDPDPHLGTLTEEELVRERVHDPELEYIFKHALTQEAAYDQLLLRRRKAYHRRVGEVIEQLYPERRQDLAAILAHHFWLGEEWEPAARHAMRAGVAALGVGARREALEHFERAYAALKSMPEPPPEAVISTVLALAPLAFNYWTYEEAVARLTEAESLARERGDKTRLASVLNWLGNLHLSAGYPSRAAPPLIESHRIAEEIGNLMLTVLPTFIMTMKMVDTDPRAALELLDRVIELARADHNGGILGHSLAMKALAQARLGNFSNVEETLSQAIEIARAADAPVREIDTLSLAALTYFAMGDVARGLQFSQRAAERSADVESGECGVYAVYTSCVGHLHGGEWEAARTAIEATAERAGLLPADSQAMPPPGIRVAQSLIARDRDLADAERVLSENQGFIGDFETAFYLHALADSYILNGRPERSEAPLGAALQYFRRVGMRPYVLRALRTLATLRDLQGLPGDAAAARAEAGELERELAGFPTSSRVPSSPQTGSGEGGATSGSVSS